jgi:DNA repair protein SbcC/Rad50
LPRSIIAAYATAALLGGVALWALWNHQVGVALALAGIVALIGIAVRLREKSRQQALRALLKMEAQLHAQQEAREEAESRVNVARVRLVHAGLPVDSIDLRNLADELLRTHSRRRLQEDWSMHDDKLQLELAAAGETLAKCLRDAGADNAGDLMAAFQAYEQACRSRADQANASAKRDSLTLQLLVREAAEKAAVDARTRRADAERNITAALAHCGLDAPDPEVASEALQRWQGQWKERLVQFDEAARDYAELVALLDGGTLEDLEARASEYQSQAEQLAVASGPSPEEAVDGDLDQRIRVTEKIASDAHSAAGSAADRARDRAQNIPSIAEAEEALTSAQQERERVARLKRTLDLTLDFLRKAQECVHRDIAPHLAAGLRQWLPSVTQHRYRDARVDPHDLSVQALGPDNEWRDARQLSHGTAEQIYLLLRVGLAERLATTGETCPLILDDVLVQSDRGRKRALLEAVLSISRDRQVILFTQEDEVLQWAQSNLTTPNRLVVLQAPEDEVGMHA